MLKNFKKADSTDICHVDFAKNLCLEKNKQRFTPIYI